MKTAIIASKRYVNFGNNGFTLIEALIGLSAFCIVAALIPISFHVFNGYDQTKIRHQAMQWEVFSSQIKKEIRMCQGINAQSNRLLLTKENETILYELSGSNLRRRLNFTGNEVLLQNIKSVRFDPIKNGVNIRVEDIWGKIYFVSVRSYLTTGN